MNCTNLGCIYQHNELFLGYRSRSSSLPSHACTLVICAPHSTFGVGRPGHDLFPYLSPSQVVVHRCSRFPPHLLFYRHSFFATHVFLVARRGDFPRYCHRAFPVLPSAGRFHCFPVNSFINEPWARFASHSHTIKDHFPNSALLDSTSLRKRRDLVFNKPTIVRIRRQSLPITDGSCYSLDNEPGFLANK